jgi:predicted ATP-binding protein involved in virulence
MHIKKLNIENFRGIRQMELELHPKMNVFIGVNGAGKSSVLDALGYLLRPAVHFLSDGTLKEDEFASDNPLAIDFPSYEIHSGMQESHLGLFFAKEELKDYDWQLRSSTFQLQTHGRGQNRTHRILSDFLRWLPYFIHCSEIPEDGNVSLVVYYRVRREVDEVPITAWTNRNFRKQDAFVDALAPKVDFKEFFEWFRNREDLENEERAESQNGPDRMLEAVRNVIGTFCDALKDVRVRRRDPLRMVVTKNNLELRIEQLSDGEKCLLAMVGDLARRLAIANPSLDNPLKGEGVVLIDEVDLHLHPQWQRMILPRLMGTFPNCQFIVTTHSPQILGELEKSDGKIIPLQDGENGIEIFPGAFNVFGQTSDVILVDVMEAPKRNEEITEMLDEIFKAIDANNLDETRRLKSELEKKAQNIPEFAKIELLLHRKEKLGK